SDLRLVPVLPGGAAAGGALARCGPVAARAGPDAPRTRVREAVGHRRPTRTPPGTSTCRLATALREALGSGGPRSSVTEGRGPFRVSPDGASPAAVHSLALCAPRARGDDPADASDHLNAGQCSPRTRGWSLPHGLLQRVRRVLPAHAGVTGPRSSITEGRGPFFACPIRLVQDVAPTQIYAYCRGHDDTSRGGTPSPPPATGGGHLRTRAGRPQAG